MSVVIATLGGDFLDELVAQHYGVEVASGALAAVLEANPGLAARGPVLPAGVEIVLPDLAPADTGVLRLWD